MEILQEMLDIIKGAESEDLKYDVNKAVADILEYMKHQIRDAQQKEAKRYAFEKIDEESAFWLRDYSQKIIPVSYREGQRSYFGKKGMSMHVDVFFTKHSGQLEKAVYLTLIYRCVQSKLDTMNIAAHVFTEFSKDFPLVHQMYAKSDNAGAYHGNQILQNFYQLCKDNGIKLIRYDYNEPCRGKDQCDRESAGAKKVINSFVEAGNDVLSAEDIFEALHYGYGLRNTKASVIEIDSSNSTLAGPNIQNISAFHSVQFYDDNMRLHRYFNVGKGKREAYNKESSFKPSYVVKKDFHHTSTESQKSKKKKKTSKMLLFCPEPVCTKVFEDEEMYESHLLSGDHEMVKETSAMDRVKSSFVRRMKVSSAEHQVHTSTKVTLSSETLSSSSEKVALMSAIKTQGWAIPKRSNFRYSVDQKKFLYDMFIQGEISGKKKSPEEVERLMREHFASTDKYVTVAQIRALFSAFSKKYGEGTLKDPAVPAEHNNKNEDLEEDITNVEDFLAEDMANAVDHVMSVLATWEIGSWVVLKYGRQWYPGQILPRDQFDESVEDDYHAITCMQRRQYGVNSFRWPTIRDIGIYHRDDLLLQFQEMIPVETETLSSGEIVWCVMNKLDFDEANNALKRALREE